MSARPFRARRSLLFVPGDRTALYPKALAAGADMVCVDLEDAVAPADKAEARRQTLALFADPAPTDAVERVVRINGLATADGLRDVLAILDSPAPPPSLMLTKVETADEVRRLARLLGEGPHAEVRFHVIIETNDGLNAAFDIARASPRIDTLLFGGVDMAAELRAVPSWENLLYARSRLVHAAAGAGLDLMDVPHLDLDDADGLARAAAAAAGLGFTGKAAIHPRQIPAINRAFTPDAATVAYARKVTEAFEANQGRLLVVDGKLIEPPALRAMYRILAVAGRAGG